MKRVQILQKLVYKQFYVHEKNLPKRNCRLKFINNLLPEKRKENMQTKQPQFKLLLNKTKFHILYQVMNTSTPNPIII